MKGEDDIDILYLKDTYTIFDDSIHTIYNDISI